MQKGHIQANRTCFCQICFTYSALSVYQRSFTAFFIALPVRKRRLEQHYSSAHSSDATKLQTLSKCHIEMFVICVKTFV